MGTHADNLSVNLTLKVAMINIVHGLVQIETFFNVISKNSLQELVLKAYGLLLKIVLAPTAHGYTRTLLHFQNYGTSPLSLNMCNGYTGVPCPHKAPNANPPEGYAECAFYMNVRWCRL